MRAEESLVVFTPSGRRGRFPVGTTVLQAARALGVDLDSVCGGRGICGRCQIVQSIGAFAKHGIDSDPGHLSPFSEVEGHYANETPLAEGRRLGCSTAVLGDVVIDVPPESQVHRQVVRKRVEVHDIEMNPAVHLRYVEVQEPDMHDPASDLRRLKEALEFEWRLSRLDCAPEVLHGLQDTLREGDWNVTVAIYDEREIVAVWPGYKDRVFGLAVDVGSTTVAAHLCDLSTGEVAAASGVMNPQIRFGEDLMSRVSYVMMNPGGERDMTVAIRDAINGLARAVADDARVDVTDILEVTFVGNPIMHHLLIGMNPIELGGAPFALATDEAVVSSARTLDLELHPNARIYVLPCIAGHVGADAAGVLLSEAPYLREEMSLVVDVGTNAEIMLGNRHRMLACSSPTGPAFEGAQISCGQRAAPGAVERVRIDPHTLEPRFRVIGADLWSDEPGFAEATAESGITGICGSGHHRGYRRDVSSPASYDPDGVDRRAPRAEARSPRVVRRRPHLLLCSAPTEPPGASHHPERRARHPARQGGALRRRAAADGPPGRRRGGPHACSTGAFGSHIDVKYAMVLGMVPDCALEHVTSAGNAAGTGARIALLDKRSRREIEGVVRRIQKIETAVEPRFQEHFVEAMAIPHRSASYPHLERVLTLPAPPRRDGEGRRTRRRARRRA